MRLGSLFVLLWLQPTWAHVEPVTDDGYDLMSRIDAEDSVVVVVRRKRLLYLLYDEAIIGAEFDDPDLRSQTAYPGFTIMQCAAYLARKPTQALQIGLGIGTVPSFLRGMGIPTDVVEISEAVVTQATDYFHYDWCSIDQDDEEDEGCVEGQTFIMDGLDFVARKPEELGFVSETKNPYDLFIVDVYTGWNPFAFFVREKMELIRENWLTRDGVLVMNFVGFMHGPRVVAPASIYRTLQSVFKYVKCFREMENPNDREAANIVFYASDELFDFNLPSTGMYENPPANTFYSVVANFPKWQLFTELNSNVEVTIHQDIDNDELQFVSKSSDSSETVKTSPVRVLTEANYDHEDFRAIHVETQNHMRERVLAQFPPALWNELKQKSSTHKNR